LLAEQHKLKGDVLMAEVNLEPLLAKALKKKVLAVKAQPISPYPCVTRDMALIAPKALSHQALMQTLERVENPLVQSIEVFDVYSGTGIPEGTRSLAYRVTLGSLARTLTDAEIDAAVAALKSALTQLPDVSLRE
jgi:phenylalanyl-tRNA synthetase beta chain